MALGDTEKKDKERNICRYISFIVVWKTEAAIVNLVDWVPAGG